MRSFTVIVASVGVLACCAALQAETIIDLLNIGNSGNADDTHGDGYGGVNYPYNIGKYEVTAGQYAEFLNAIAATDTYGLYATEMWSSVYGCKIERTGSPGSYTYSVAANWAYRPVNFVSFWDTCRFANWLHNGQPTGAQGTATTEDGVYTLDGYTGDDGSWITRNPGWTWAIPTEDEWYKAAYHKNDGVTGNYFGYPTSSDSTPGRDMTETTNPGNNANYYGTPFPIDPPYYTTVAGEFELSDSPYGTFDQGGNVWEWNETVPGGTSRGLRGGSFYSLYVEALHAEHRCGIKPPNEGFLVGFRVVYVPEPATLSLLLFAGIVALRRRR